MRLERSRVQLLAVPLSGNDLGQVVHTRASVTKQYNLVPVVGQQCPATGKVTVGPTVIPACVTYLSGLSTYGIKEDKHPANTPRGVSCSLPFVSEPNLHLYALTSLHNHEVQ